MRYSPSGVGEDFDDESIALFIACFVDIGESGPHSPEGWVLSQILNFCVRKNIPFTLAYTPGKGYYVKRGVVDGVLPEEIRLSFEEA